MVFGGLGCSDYAPAPTATVGPGSRGGGGSSGCCCSSGSGGVGVSQLCDLMEWVRDALRLAEWSA